MRKARGCRAPANRAAVSGGGLAGWSERGWQASGSAGVWFGTGSGSPVVVGLEEPSPEDNGEDGGSGGAKGAGLGVASAAQSGCRAGLPALPSVSCWSAWALWYQLTNLCGLSRFRSVAAAKLVKQGGEVRWARMTGTPEAPTGPGDVRKVELGSMKEVAAERSTPRLQQSRQVTRSSDGSTGSSAGSFCRLGWLWPGAAARRGKPAGCWRRSRAGALYSVSPDDGVAERLEVDADLVRASQSRSVTSSSVNRPKGVTRRSRTR